MPKRDSNHKYRISLLIAGGTVLLALLLGLALPIWKDTHDRVPQGVSLGGLELGGKTRREAREAIAAAGGALTGRSLALELPQGRILLTPEQMSFRLESKRAASDACKAEPGAALSLSPYLSYDEKLLREGLEGYARKNDTVLTQPQAVLSGPVPALEETAYDPEAPCPELMLTLGTPERHLDVETAMKRIGAYYAQALAGAEDTLTLEVPASAEPQHPDLEALYEEFCVDPVDAALDLENYGVIPGAYGCRFDPEAARALIARAEAGETIAIPMACVPPERLSDGVYFQDELGHCETPHSSNENRNTNLRLLCQILDGYVIQPGEEFSYNGVIGERTPERGFKPAPAYSGNRLIQDYGGGVCQGSSTLYNCVLLADLEVTHRVCHGVKVGYLPLGLDAAVNWGTKTDLSFRNNFHFPMMIRAEVADGYVKMKLMGTDEKDYYVEMECRSGAGEGVTYATSYKRKYDKATGELISREVEARSTYYQLG